MPQINLVQPRHTYAPSADKQSQGHIYMPTSLLTTGARLLEAGVELDIQDENLSSIKLSSHIIGINLVGAPYIPEAMKLQQRIEKIQKDSTYILGGQVMSGLESTQFRRLFGNTSYKGNYDQELAKALGINFHSLPSLQKTSLIPAYDKLDDNIMKMYLSTEFSLFVSQGCKFACEFCAAVRTFRDQTTGEIRRIKEVYRDPEIIKNDLNYLVKRAKKLGVDKLQMYMTNLDVFQTPDELLKFAYVVKEIKKQNPGFYIQLRGLACVDSFITARDTHIESIEELVGAGFDTVGFGIDGMTPEVWNAVKKGHNTKDKCLEAIRSAREDFGITPQALMVFGHPEIDTERTLRLAYEFTLDMVERYGAVPRPHIAKSFIPGNNGWIDPKNHEKVEALIKNPESFQALDFTAIPSKLTHPDNVTREAATKYFLQICSIPGNTTLFVKPITSDLTPEEKEGVYLFNEGRYDF